MTAKADLRAVSAHNTKIVIDLIHNAGCTSRIDIARKTGLSPTTVTSLLTPLLAQEMVRETGKASSSGGRRSTLLEINRAYGCFVGITLKHASMELSMVDFGFTCVKQGTVKLPTQVSHVQLTNMIKREITQFRCGNLLGIGVAVAGTVNSERGTIANCAVLTKGDYEISTALSRAFGAGTYVENIERLKALHAVSEIPDAHSLLCFDIGGGIGAGLVIDGKLQHGAHAMAGEIGHTVVVPAGPKCTLGHQGCLESVANETAILRACSKAAGRVVELEELDLLHASMEPIRGIMADKAGLVSSVLAPVVDCLDPDVLVLTGPVFEQSHAFFLQVCEQTRARSFAARARPLTRFTTHTFTRDDLALGLARLVWRQERADNKHLQASA